MPIFAKRGGMGIQQLGFGTTNVFDGGTGLSIGRAYASETAAGQWTEHWVVFDKTAYLEMRGIRLQVVPEAWSQATLDGLRRQSGVAATPYRYIRMDFSYKVFPSGEAIGLLPNWIEDGVLLVERRLVNGGATTGWLHREIDADQKGGIDYWVFSGAYVPPTDVEPVACGNYSASFRNARNFMATKDKERAGATNWLTTSIRWSVVSLPTVVG